MKTLFTSFILALALPVFGQDMLVTIYGDTINGSIVRQDAKMYYVNLIEKPGKEIKYPKSIIKEVLREDFIQEDSEGNWMYQEVVEYDSSIVKSSDIIENIERWLLDKRTLFNTAAGEDLEMPENVIEKNEKTIKGFIHGRVTRSFMEQYLMRIHVKVDVKPGRYRITFMEAIPLAMSITMVAGTTANQVKPLAANDVRKYYSKQKGELAFVPTIKRLLSQVKIEALKSYGQTDDDW
ncbi:MAG: hypothetical protein RIC19_24460 [Phaeodactylibacter sp.]|uniref:hypothetical protein n=1 Tax=Phaeodactylibacter sp. TaxID=1940289 RepID=UPI0032EAE890